MLQTEQSSESLVARGWALFFYGFGVVVGLGVIALHLWRYGVTQPETFVAPIAILFLSFVWLWRAAKSGPPTKVKLGIHSTILLLLIGADSISSIFRQ
jgi:hypothetical protein